MKIYTGYGDTGMTRLVGGTRAKKNDSRVAAYGSIDTLNSQVGYAASLLCDETLKQELLFLQQKIFNCSSDFAVPDEIRPYKVTKEMIEWLENRIDVYWENLPRLSHFILPGGSQQAAAFHLCRCSARDAERQAAALIDDGGTFNPEALRFLNRLSDYFFALARWQNQRDGQPERIYEDSPPVFEKRNKYVSDPSKNKE